MLMSGCLTSSQVCEFLQYRQEDFILTIPVSITGGRPARKIERKEEIENCYAQIASQIPPDKPQFDRSVAARMSKPKDDR